MNRLNPFVFILLFAFQISRAESIHIVLDPSHGGPNDLGITASGFDEKTQNLLLVKKIQTLLEIENDNEVVLTRIGDYPVAPNERRKIANQYSPSVYVSIHFSLYEKEPSLFTHVLKQTHAKTNSILTPIESIHSKEYNHSIKLAEMIEDAFPEHVDHQIILSEFALSSIIGIETPAVMIECQCAALNQPTIDEGLIDTVARAISEGVQTFVRKVY